MSDLCIFLGSVAPFASSPHPPLNLPGYQTDLGFPFELFRVFFHFIFQCLDFCRVGFRPRRLSSRRTRGGLCFKLSNLSLELSRLWGVDVVDQVSRFPIR